MPTQSIDYTVENSRTLSKPCWKLLHSWKSWLIGRSDSPFVKFNGIVDEKTTKKPKIRVLCRIYVQKKCIRKNDRPIGKWNVLWFLSLLHHHITMRIQFHCTQTFHSYLYESFSVFTTLTSISKSKFNLKPLTEQWTVRSSRLHYGNF